ARLRRRAARLRLPLPLLEARRAAASLCFCRGLIAREQCWFRCRGFSWISRPMGLAFLLLSSSAPSTFHRQHPDLWPLNLPTPKAPVPSIFFFSSVSLSDCGQCRASAVSICRSLDLSA